MFTVRGFLKAAARGDTEAVAGYLRRSDAADCIAGRDSEGNTALHLAAKGDHVETLAALLKAGCDLHALNHAGNTPLLAAVQQHAPKVIPPLIAAGADVNGPVPNNWESALNVALARYNYSPDIVRLLLDAGADVNKGAPMLKAIDVNAYDLAGEMLKAGADPNATGSRSSARPIHHAAENGQDGFLKALVEKGVDINAQDGYGNTPLHLAIAQGHKKIVEFLLEKGARLDLVNSYSKDGYAQARERHHAAITEMIGARVQEAIGQKTTPLTASADALPARDAETWLRMGGEQVARVSVYPALARRITEIFNFESRERLIISENLKTQAENITPPVPFDTTPEKLLQKALDAFRDLGGQADDEAVFGTRLQKKALKP